ncbi:hypothetical protein CR956_00885 [Candidatus Saccharibacteria bacterium]|nr:MAG: hypothetical protein CR956_00885 [Candidatus Saccharibacteria bacterium]
MVRFKWKRFRPKHKGNLHDHTSFEVDTIYTRAREIVDEAMQSVRSGRGSRGRLKRINEALHKLVKHNSPDPEYRLARLILRTPGAVRAQMEMDKHQSGYSDYKTRLFELIDFNDAFDDTVLSLPEELLSDFPERLKNEMEVFCRDNHTEMFSDRQYEAIVYGLSREIALYRGAKKLGYQVRMTSRVQDAMGVDMVITDPQTKKSINIDCKTRSSFHFRLIKLLHKHRINEGERLRCELSGFCKVRNKRDNGYLETVLFRLSDEELGGIENFDYIKIDPLAKQIRKALEEHGVYINQI